jgi:leucyl/phenylalanyl-tRNA--protein transferase
MPQPRSSLRFPPAGAADEDGLLAMGGDLQPGTLLDAYRNGIFPWFNEGDPILWWSPDPRCVLFPAQLKVHTSMRPLLHGERFRFTTNQCFEKVMRQCAAVPRKGQNGTWISEEMVEAYCVLHQLGYAHSAEAWEGNRLAGGLYGLRIGNVFFGESMFSRVSNASKYTFIRYVRQLESEGVVLIDCQQHTTHLQSLGAELISRGQFLQLLQLHCGNG